MDWTWRSGSYTNALAFYRTGSTACSLVGTCLDLNVGLCFGSSRFSTSPDVLHGGTSRYECRSARLVPVWLYVHASVHAPNAMPWPPLLTQVSSRPHGERLVSLGHASAVQDVCPTCFCAIPEPCTSSGMPTDGWALKRPAHHHTPPCQSA